MPYEIDNQGRTNEVHRITTPAPVERDNAPAPMARVEQIGGMTRVTVRSDNSNPNEKPAPRARFHATSSYSAASDDGVAEGPAAIQA